MNKAIIIGNITKDLELKKTSGGISSVSFTVAVQRKFANAQGTKETDFLTVVAWRQLADICAKYLSKGSKVCVTGSIQSRSYTSQDGSKRYVTEIIADDVEFLTARGERTNDNNAEDDTERPGEMTEANDDELPF